MPLETHVVLADLHIPFGDDRALAVALKIAKAAKPDTIWLLGDILDFAPISRFRDAARYDHDVQDELDECVALLQKLRRAHPKAAINWMLGNHEHRLKHYLWTNAAAIRNLRTSKLEQQFRYDKNDEPLNLGVTFLHDSRTLARGDFHIKHGTKSNIYATRHECDTEGRSGLSAHTHRPGTWVWRTPGSGQRRWDTIGCLCGLNAPYRQDDQAPSHWNHGLGVLTVAGRDVGVENVTINNGRAIWRGKAWVA